MSILTRIATIALATAITAFSADPIVGTVTLSPTFTPSGSAAQVTITASIADTSLIAGGANVQRLDATGRAISVAGVLHDDGLNGDSVAGDKIFTLRFTVNEVNTGRLYFRASAAFPSLVQRVTSSVVAVDIGVAAAPLALAGTITPAPNAAGWNNADTTVTWSCSGGAGGSESCPSMVRVSTEAKDQVVSVTATDGSRNSVPASVTVSLDKTSPVIAVGIPIVPLPPGTFVGNITDALSGIASLTCGGAAATITGQSFTCTAPVVPGANTIILLATDVAGNKATSTQNVVYNPPPVMISAVIAPAPNSAGWNKSNATVTFTCTGGIAPVRCPAPVAVSSDIASRVVSGTATDSTGSTASASVTVNLDKTAPTLSVTSPLSGATVTTPQLALRGIVSDALSGVATVTCKGLAAVLTGSNFACNLTLVPGPNTIAVQATDVAGNSTSAPVTVTYEPANLTISGVAVPSPNAAGWNNANVSVTFTCGGGVAPLTCPASVLVATETAGQAIARTVSDSTGATANASITVKLDKTPPALRITSPAPGATVNTPLLALAGTATDTLSGVAAVTCNALPATVTGSNLACSLTLVEEINTIVLRATDIAGNTTTASISVTLTSPTLTISAAPTPAPNSAGWNNTNVTVAFTCAGGTAPLTCPPSAVISTEGANQSKSGTVTDSGGMTATASVAIKLDKTAPVVAITSPASGTTVTTPQLALAGRVSDALSGLATVTCNGSAATLTASNLACNLILVSGLNTIAVKATDVAGNVTTTSISVTLALPTLTISALPSPLPNSAGWNNASVTVSFTCTGGVAPLTCPQPVVVSTETAGQLVSGTVTDSTSKTAATSLTVKLDKTPPAIAVSSPVNGTTVPLAAQTISGTLVDVGSGLAAVTCNGSAATVTGARFNCGATLTLGSNSIPIAATDIAGNTSTFPLTLIYNAAPRITLTAPANLSYLNLSPTTVSGTVDSRTVVTINSIPATVANGRFSVQVPLAEGPNILTASAAGASGTGTASIQVTLDTTPPHVTITSPPDQFVTTESNITVAGSINDIVVGTVNSQQAQVTVNGAAAQVANRTFLVSTVALNLGTNVIQAVGRDRVGNQATTQITVTRQAPPSAPLIRLVSGNNQTGIIGSTLPTPLIVSLLDAAGLPLAGKPVIFKVSQNNGMLSAGGVPAASLVATTNPLGRAQVQWTLGMRAGAGGNAVEAYSVGSEGTALFSATGAQGPAGKIVVDTGNAQVAEINQPLPKPLIAVVVDSGNNRLAGVPVTFTVKQGGGNFGGQPSLTVTSDSDGRVAATLTLGFQEGNANNIVEANFPSNVGYPAGFTASGRAAGNRANTTITGVVLDNSNVPIPGVKIQAVLTNVATATPLAANTVQAVLTNAQGQFSIPQAPVGFVKLLVDGSTAQLPGTYPHLDYDMVTVAGQNNTVGQPIFLLPLNTANQLCVTATTGGGTLTMPEAPGFSLTFSPGQVTFPGGSKQGCVNVTAVHGDKVPMTPGFGQQPQFIVTIQPAGAVFNPPAAITLPNVDGLVARAVTEMYSFDHDIGSFVAIGTGTVSDDGQVIRSNPGVGVLKAGWHCGGNPNQPGTVATCPVCTFCQGTTCTPQGNATPCGNGGTCQFTGRTTAPICICPQGQYLDPTTSTCERVCPSGYSLAAGQCCQGPTCVPPQCPTGMVFDSTTGTCSSPCPPAYTFVAGQCCQGNSCVPPCPSGQTFNTGNGTCQSQCGTCNGGNPCIDSSCGANNQCVPSPNQLCQDACRARISGSCAVGSLIGTCSSSGNCDLCPSLGSGASCSCSISRTGTCNAVGTCECAAPSVQISLDVSSVQKGVFYYSPPTVNSTVSPSNGIYSWTTNNSAVLGIVGASSGPNLASVPLRINGIGVATLKLSYSVQGFPPVEDSVVFVLSKDIAVVGWIDGSPISAFITPGVSGELVSSLNGNNCLPTIVAWMEAAKNGGSPSLPLFGPMFDVTGQIDRDYANRFLIKYSANDDPGGQIDSLFQSDRTRYRQFARFQAAYVVRGSSIIGQPKQLTADSRAGRTLDPCYGLNRVPPITSRLPYVPSPEPELHRLNGSFGVRNNGRSVYFFHQSRVGQDGQAGDTYLNDRGGVIGKTTPWTFILIEFGPNGDFLSPVTHQIFPTYSVYDFPYLAGSGSLLSVGRQQGLQTFIDRNDQDQIQP